MKKKNKLPIGIELSLDENNNIKLEQKCMEFKPLSSDLKRKFYKYNRFAQMLKKKEQTMELVKEQSKFSHDLALLINYLLKKGYSVTLGEAWRPQVTADYYAKTGQGIQHSLHCQRLAIDLNIFNEKGVLFTDPEQKEYIEIGTYWESLDAKNRWGGNFIVKGKKKPDADHFERRQI